MFEKNYEISLALNEEAGTLSSGSHEIASHNLVVQPYYKIGPVTIPTAALNIPFHNDSSERQEQKIKEDFESLMAQRIEIARLKTSWYSSEFIDNAKTILAESLVYQMLHKKDLPHQILQTSLGYSGEDGEKIKKAIYAHKDHLSKACGLFL